MPVISTREERRSRGLEPGGDHRHHRRGRPLLAAALTFVMLAACGDDDSSTSTSTSQTSTPQTTTTQAAADLTGAWTGTWAIDPPYADVTGTFTMDLVQTGGSFNGNVVLTNTDCSDGPVSGTIVGTSLAYSWLTNPQPVQLTGEVSGSTMSGTWAALACSDPNISLTGTWEATKQP